MKNCGGCWHGEELPRDERCWPLKCKLTGLYTSDCHGKSCLVHRARELGRPFGVWVEVPEPYENGTCNRNCERLVIHNGEIANDFCVKGLAVPYEVEPFCKPGPGCPRYANKGESLMTELCGTCGKCVADPNDPENTACTEAGEPAGADDPSCDAWATSAPCGYRE